MRSFITHTSQSIIRVIKLREMKWMDHVASMAEMRNARKTVVGKPEGKSPLGRHRCRWEDNVRMGLREIGWEGMD
jgi:hypothetical protein